MLRTTVAQTPAAVASANGLASMPIQVTRGSSRKTAAAHRPRRVETRRVARTYVPAAATPTAIALSDLSASSLVPKAAVQACITR